MSLKEMKASLAEAGTSAKALAASFSRKDLHAKVQHCLSNHVAVATYVAPMLSDSGAKLTAAIRGDKDLVSHMVEVGRYMAPSERSAWSDNPFTVLFKTNEAYIGILKGLDKELESYVGVDKINLANMRNSMVLISGVLHQSDLICDYIRNGLSIFNYNYCGSSAPTKAQLKRMETSAEVVGGAINDLSANRGAVILQRTIADMRKAANDLPLLDSDHQPQLTGLTGNNRGVSANLVTAGVAGLPFIRDLGMMINLLRKKIAGYLREEEDWMMQHTTLLSVKLSGMDENDPEYIRIKKQIDKYHEMVTILSKLRSAIY